MSDQEELETKALALPDQAKALAVKNDTDFRVAGDFLMGVSSLKKEIKATFDPIVDAAHKAHQVAVSKRKAVLEPVESAERIVKGALSTYQLEQERAKRELEEAEKARVAAEKEAILKAAQEQAAAGNMIAAKAVAREAFDLKPEPVAITPKVEGLSFRDNWRFEIVDPSALPREYLVPDTTKIGAVAKALKDSCNIPGVRVWCEKVAIGRAS